MMARRLKPRPRHLDLFCGAGGASFGYHLAGCEVTGVDINPQPRYPFRFIQADANTFDLDGYDSYSGSPPCQDHSATAVLGHEAHGTGWMLADTIARFEATGKPWVVENVVGSALPEQDTLLGEHGLELCGCMFPVLRGQIYEPRRFQTSFGVPQLAHVPHIWPVTKMGRRPVRGECMQVTGHFTDAAEGRARMCIPWMSRDELAQAIPPAYTKYIGLHMMALIDRAVT